ncbi:MAG: GlsB/YeaQ/YmgE family stress response membrane protein [Novosphingobium sp.]
MEYGFIGWIVVGLIAGALAKWIMPGKDPGGLLVTVLIGIAGGVLGGFVSSKIGLAGSGNIVNILIATAGAVVLLWLYRVFKSRSAN